MTKIVLITGASSGIGQACAIQMRRRGNEVYGTSRRVDQLGVDPDGGFWMLPMDVDDDDSVQRGVELVLERHGRLDVLVANAGIGVAGAIEDTRIDEAKAQFETNFFGVVRVCSAALPTMRQQRSGHIIIIGSLAGRAGVPFQGFYSAAKFALEGLAEALRVEVRPFGVRVALVEPGDLSTPFTVHRHRTAQSQPDSAYWTRFDTALRIMENDERRGADPRSVARVVEKIIATPNPRLRYTVGPAFQRLAIALKRIVPHRLFEWGLTKYYKLDKLK